MRNRAKKRAGVVILKRFSDCYRLLGLRIYGSFDLPKGGVDQDENILDAALRETQEECGITNLNFEWGLDFCRTRNVILFVASTNESPIIKPNPKTGEFEHHAARWLTLDQAENMLHPYLRAVVPWVRQKTGIQ